jgi:hypothetical protein
MNHHDTCWFCKGIRATIVVGYSAIGFVCTVAGVISLLRGHGEKSALEFAGTFIAFGSGWFSLKVLDWWDVFFEETWPK